MKYLFLTCFYFSSIAFALCQQTFTIHNIKLPAEIAYYDNQFSGLQIADGKLFLLSESRLQDNREPKIYSILLTDLEHAKQDTNYVLSYQLHHINGLESLRESMTRQGQSYEGLEAFIIKDSSIYLSVETNTPSPFCYLLKGRFINNEINLSTTLLPVRKPRKPDGGSIYNAGFEAISLINNKLYAFYEYNYFEQKSFAYSCDTSLAANSIDSALFPTLPFRITDMTSGNSNHFTAINYFYKGDGEDTVYRVPVTDKKNHSLIYSDQHYHNYCRLIDVQYQNNSFAWKLIWEFPEPYNNYNWEGIAADGNGFYIMNDKYTPARPYSSVLLYLEKKK